MVTVGRLEVAKVDSISLICGGRGVSYNRWLFHKGEDIPEEDLGPPPELVWGVVSWRVMRN